MILIVHYLNVTDGPRHARLGQIHESYYISKKRNEQQITHAGG